MLEPRPWTIAQSEWAIELLSSVPDGPVLELCCGAGQIGLVVAVATGRSLVQVDDHELAGEYARRNAQAAGVPSDVRCASLESAVGDDEQFLLVIADPPYVPSDRVGAYDADPVHAIDGGADGLDVARRCAAVAARVLAPGGAVIVQTWGAEQATELAGDRPHEIRSFASDRALLLLPSWR